MAEGSEGLKERIERRLGATGQTARSASLAAELSDGFIRNILEGKSLSPRGENLARIARQLGTTEVWLLRAEGPEEVEFLERLQTRSEILHAPHVTVPSPSDMPRDLPVIGSTAGAILAGKTFEGFTFDPSRIVDRVSRPPGVRNTTDAYAVWVVGSAMKPMYQEGGLLIVHPHRPSRPGDAVVIQVRVSDGAPLQAFIKLFVGRTDGYVIARQLNPEATHRFKESTVVAVHRVLTTAELVEA